MAAGNNLNLSIILRAVDRASGPIRQINGRLQAMNAPFRRLSFEMGRFAQLSGLSAVRSGLADVSREATALTAKVTALGAGLAFAFNRTFVTPHAELKRLQQSIAELEGSAEAGGKAMAWIQSFAASTPLDISETAMAFRSLRMVGIDPMAGSLQALVDQNAKIGGTSENLLEITRQLGQAYSKGRLQLEEVNVLQERAFDVVGLLSRAYGKSAAEVRKAISEGKIGTVAITKAIRQAGIEADGAAKRQASGWTGLMGRLGGAWENIRTVIMDSGPFKFLEDRLRSLTEWLERMTQSAEGMAQLREIGTRITGAFVTMEAGAKQLWTQIEALAERVGGFGNLAKIALGGVAAILAGPLLMGIGTLSLAIVQLGAGLAVALGPWGIVLAAVAAAIGVVYTHWDDLVKLYQDTITSVSDGIESTVNVFKGLADVIRNGIGSAIQWIADKWRSFVDATAGIRRIFGFVGGHLASQITGSVPPSMKTIAGGNVVPFPSQRVATPSPFTGMGARQAQQTEFKHNVALSIDSEGKPRVREMKSNARNAILDVDAGLMGAAW